ncbi:MAG TPA: response regulator [Chloroflexia bacterium]|nr:response regulator [Chloroflexia bacterium]
MPKVLVVDDDPDLAAICSLILESEGYETAVATNGVEAYDKLSDTPVDAILLDVMMPVMDGLTVCRMVKSDPKTEKLPVIVMSASEKLREQARVAHADAVIPKPFNIDDLVLAVNSLVLSDSA